MPDEPAAEAQRDRLQALLVVCVLAVASIVIAMLATSPARVSSTELLGDARDPGDRAFIASHRGGGATAPENTLPAISAALAAGFDYVEVDVALTADRHAVLLHDATLDRTTDGSGLLAEHTLDQVKRLDAGAWFAPEYSGTPVPTFAEFLDVLAASTQRAIVEFKGLWDAESIQVIVDEIAARGLEERVVLASFDARTLALAEAASEVVARMLILKHAPDDITAAAREAGVRGVILDRREVIERPQIVDDLHAEGVRVVVYTLNSDRQWDEVTALGVDGIVTDDPRTLSDWQEEAAGEREGG